MEGIPPADPGRAIDWSRASCDYAAHRPGYPPSFHARLAERGLGLPGQRVCDLGTGTGVVARALARAGCSATGVDVAEGQIDAARRLAREEGLAVDFRVAPAEDTGLPSGAFDLVPASQCWLYFDHARAGEEVLRLLAPGGRLVVCHLCWLPRADALARATEALVLEHNPAWSAADWSGAVAAMPAGTPGRYRRIDQLVWDEPLGFTRESWRGRIRACRGVGASLSTEEVARFDRAHAELLDRIAPPAFPVLHRIDVTVLAPVDSPSP